MDRLFFESKDKMTPTIQFEPDGDLTISGYSSPNDVREIYQPALNWVVEYLKEPQEKTVMNFKMFYYNTASSKMFLLILQELVRLHEDLGKDLEINWYYEKLDEDMAEAADDLEDIIDFDINRIPMEEDE